MKNYIQAIAASSAVWWAVGAFLSWDGWWFYSIPQWGVDDRFGLLLGSVVLFIVTFVSLYEPPKKGE